MHSKQYLLDCGGSVLSPILGIWASQNYPRITNSYESIATINVGAGGQSAATFTSIPSTFKHLQIRCIMKKAGTGNDSFSLMTLNSDTGNNYATHYLLGTGSVVLAGANAPSVGNIFAGVTWGTGSSFSSSAFSVAVIDILD